MPSDPQSVASVAATFVSRYYNSVVKPNPTTASMFDTFATMAVADVGQGQASAHVGNGQIAQYLVQRELIWGATKVLLESVDYVPVGQPGNVLITCYGKFLHRTEERRFVETFMLQAARSHTHYLVQSSTLRILSVSPYQRLPAPAVTTAATAAPAAPAPAKFVPPATKSAQAAAPKAEKSEAPPANKEDRPAPKSKADGAKSDKPARAEREKKPRGEKKPAPDAPVGSSGAANTKADGKPAAASAKPAPNDDAAARPAAKPAAEKKKGYADAVGGKKEKESFKAILFNVPDGVKKNEIYEKTEKFGKVLDAQWFGRGDDHCVVEFATAKSLERFLGDAEFSLGKKVIRTKAFDENKK